MYYLLYGFLYLLSLLPFFILYRISDLIFFLIYYIAGYRRKIVTDNLCIAFPEKTGTERKKIAKQFYRNLTDSFIETIKMLSITEREFEKRASINFEVVRALEQKGFNIQIHSGHQMNWEYGSLAVSRLLTVPWLAVYSRINARPVDRLFIKIRSKFGAVMIAAQTYQLHISKYLKDQHVLGLIADQNPPHAYASKAYWLNFFSKPAPFLIAPEKGAVRNKTAVVFVNPVKLKRGYYHFECSVITENAGSFAKGELTRLYRDFLEAGIKRQPGNYLWSHRRWKIGWSDSFAKRWIDNKPHP